MSHQTDKKELADLGIGARFQEETKYKPEKMGGYTLDWNNMPELYKHYKDPLSRMPLPQPAFGGDTDLWTLIRQRRSRRMYTGGQKINLTSLSTLLWATQGLTAHYGDNFFRTAPSAGGLYPVETYLCVRSVDTLEPGLYHFRPRQFDLEFLKKGDYSGMLADAALGQTIVSSAQVTFVWSAILPRSKWKYRERAYRYIYLDAGHIAQNLYLSGEALGLGVCAIGAFFDDEANALFGLGGTDETVIYMATVGKQG